MIDLKFRRRDNRRLRNLDHFKKYKGSLVKIKLNTPVNGAMTITGVISDVNDEFIFLVSDMVVKVKYPLLVSKKPGWCQWQLWRVK